MMQLFLYESDNEEHRHGPSDVKFIHKFKCYNTARTLAVEQRHRHLRTFHDNTSWALTREYDVPSPERELLDEDIL